MKNSKPVIAGGKAECYLICKCTFSVSIDKTNYFNVDPGANSRYHAFLKLIVCFQCYRFCTNSHRIRRGIADL